MPTKRKVWTVCKGGQSIIAHNPVNLFLRLLENVRVLDHGNDEVTDGCHCLQKHQLETKIVIGALTVSILALYIEFAVHLRSNRNSSVCLSGSSSWRRVEQKLGA